MGFWRQAGNSVYGYRVSLRQYLYAGAGAAEPTQQVDFASAVWPALLLSSLKFSRLGILKIGAIQGFLVLMSDLPTFQRPTQLQAEDVVRAAARGPRGATGPGDDRNGGNDGGGRTNTGIAVKPRAKVKKPSMYKVLMLNDDYTPMEFVVHVLERYFGKSTEEATRIMLHVHQKGVGICGVFTFEVAETKVNQTMELARKNQHPLQCTLEKE